jgi:hypothetical protein
MTRIDIERRTVTLDRDRIRVPAQRPSLDDTAQYSGGWWTGQAADDAPGIK